MAQNSAFKTAEHEPFNPDRTWGRINARLKKTGDEDEMRAAVQAVVAQRYNIKHCVEVVDMRLTRALIDACQEHGYCFFVLTRREEPRRLRSLFLAEITGAWGPTDAAEKYPPILSGAVKLPPVRNGYVRRQVANDTRALGQTLVLLRNRQVAYEWIVFEDFYFGPRPAAEQAIEIAAVLGREIGANDPTLGVLGEKGAQNSDGIERLVPNYASMMRLLNELCVT